MKSRDEESNKIKVEINGQTLVLYKYFGVQTTRSMPLLLKILYFLFKKCKR